MKSYFLIPGACFSLWVLHWTGTIPNSSVPWAFFISFIIMDFLGLFNREKQTIQAEFQAKNDADAIMDEINKIDEEIENEVAIITMTDKDGNTSRLIIKGDGSLYKEGDPDPNVVRVAIALQDSVAFHGPEAVAKEIEKQMAEYYRQLDEHEAAQEASADKDSKKENEVDDEQK